MERLLQDVRFAVRVLLKDRGFTATAALTLAICIGANAAIFAVVDSVLLQPLPVPHPEQLVHMYNAYPGRRRRATGGSTGVPDYYDRLRETDVFQEQALYNSDRRHARPGRQPAADHRPCSRTPSLLRLLQVASRPRAACSREEEGEVGKTHKAVLTYAELAAAVRRPRRRDRPGPPDQRRTVRGRRCPAAGLLVPRSRRRSSGCRSPSPPSRSPTTRGTATTGRTSARLKPGATIEQARQQIDALNARNLDRFPAAQADPHQRRLPHASSSRCRRTWCASCAAPCTCCGAASRSSCSSASSTSRT